MSATLPQPPIAPPGDWSFPTPRHATLDNGLEVIWYQLPGQHIAAAHLMLDVPLNAEPADVEGVETIAARVLDEGTAGHPGESFAEALESAGAGFGIDVSLSGLQTVLDVPTTRLEPALGLFAEAVIEPSLAESDVTRHVALRLAEIEQARANSAQVASIAFRGAVFDPGARASRMNGGEPETVSQVTRAAVADYWRRQVGPDRTTLILAGDFPTDPVALADACFGSWQNPEQTAVPRQPASAGPRRAILIDRPGAVQADLRLGAYGVDRLDPRWPDLTVASYAMGGAFLSRLNAVLREDKGYTYGVRLNFSPLRRGGSYAVQGSFRTEVAADAVRIALELLDVSKAPFTTQEVDEAVNFFVGVSPLRYATADGVADQAALQVLAGLPEDYVDTHLRAVRAVTPESATAAYVSTVDLDALTLVVAGDAATLADPLRAAGFPDLEIRGS